MGIKVPKVTLKADYGDESAFGELSLLSIGYGLHQAWVYATMFGTDTIFQTAAQESGVYGNHITFPFLVSIFVFAICLLLIAATDQKLLRIYVSKKTLAFGALCMCIGTAILIIPTLNSELIVGILELASGILTGVGSALMIVFWGIAFSRCDSSSIILNTVVAIVISVAFYAFVLNQIYFYAAAIITSLVPLVEYVILSKKTPDSFFLRKDLPIFCPLPIKKIGLVKCFGIPVFIFGLALGLMRQTYIQSILPTTATIDKFILVVIAMCASMLILLTIVAIGNKSRRRDFLYRPLIPLIAVTVLFLPLTLNGKSDFANYVLLAGYISFEALLWIFFAETSQRFRISPCLVFGMGRGLSAVASCVTAVVIHFSTELSVLISENTFVLPVALLIIMFIAYAILPNAREIESIVLPCPLIQFTTDPEGNTVKIQQPSYFHEITHNAREHMENKENEEARNKKPADDETTSEKAARPQVNDYAQAKDNEAPISEARAAMYANTSSSVKKIGETRVPYGRFHRKCEAVANTFLLSKREIDVLFYLAKGHKSSYIQEKLYISEGTAKTHIRHIYRKMNVHTQQELMRLVEDLEVEDIPLNAS